MGVNKTIDITTKQRETIIEILQTYLPKTTVWAFGSRVKFTSRPESDLDLVAFIKPEQKSLLAGLKEALDESDLPFQVDLLDWDSIPESFKKNIEKEYVVLIKVDEGPKERSGWKRYRLGEIADLQTGPFGTQLRRQENVNGTQLITVGHLGENRIIYKNLPYVSDDAKVRLKEYTLKEGDIVFSREGDRWAYVKNHEDGWLFSGRCLRVRPKSNNIDSKYLSYFFGLKDFKNIIRGIISGTMPSLNTSIMSEIEVDLPELSLQQSIASILSSLDDKIELNLQMNQTLETMAHAIFKEWFVNFNFPCFDGQFENGLPKGWEKRSIRSVAKNIQYGYTPSSSTHKFRPKFLGVTDIQNGMVDWGLVPDCAISDKEYEKYKIQEHDIFIVLVGPSTGENIYIINHPAAVFASYLIRIQFTQPELALYIGKFLRGPEYSRYISSVVSGSTRPNLNAQTLANTEVILPDEKILKKYYEIIFPFQLRIEENQKENQTLTQIRDSLLPGLMSGKQRRELSF